MAFRALVRAFRHFALVLLIYSLNISRGATINCSSSLHFANSTVNVKPFLALCLFVSAFPLWGAMQLRWCTVSAHHSESTLYATSLFLRGKHCTEWKRINFSWIYICNLQQQLIPAISAGHNQNDTTQKLLVGGGGLLSFGVGQITFYVTSDRSRHPWICVSLTLVAKVGNCNAM